MGYKEALMKICLLRFVSVDLVEVIYLIYEASDYLVVMNC